MNLEKAHIIVAEIYNACNDIKTISRLEDPRITELCDYIQSLDKILHDDLFKEEG